LYSRSEEGNGERKKREHAARKTKEIASGTISAPEKKKKKGRRGESRTLFFNISCGQGGASSRKLRKCISA